MASQMVTRIKAATEQAWPEVSRAMQQTTLRVAEIAGLGEQALTQVEAYVSAHDRGFWKRRQICTETVWALARLGFLRTGEEADIVAAAEKLVAYYREQELSERDLEPEEVNLITAVNALPSWE